MEKYYETMGIWGVLFSEAMDSAASLGFKTLPTPNRAADETLSLIDYPRDPRRLRPNSKLDP